MPNKPLIDVPDDDEDDEDTVTVRVQESNFSEEIWVFIPPHLWDDDNLGELIKRAVTTVVANIPDKLDA